MSRHSSGVAMAPVGSPDRNRSRASWPSCRRWRSSSNSLPVMSSARRPSNSAGRSSGVACSYLLVKFPWISGSPQAVFGGVYGLLPAVLAGAWAMSADDMTSAAADPIRNRTFIELLRVGAKCAVSGAVQCLVQLCRDERQPFEADGNRAGKRHERVDGVLETLVFDRHAGGREPIRIRLALVAQRI